jgi:hypothetical protein
MNNIKQKPNLLEVFLMLLLLEGSRIIDYNAAWCMCVGVLLKKILFYNVILKCFYINTRRGKTANW